MDADVLVREWDILTGLLPVGWREMAMTTGALRRARQVRDPGTLLLLILLHVAAGLSLRQASARAKRAGVASISDVALLKRLRGARKWLHALAAALFADHPSRPTLRGVARGRRVRVVDATTVSEPGSTGTDWRIHYSLELPSLECDFFEVTDPSGGESYTRFPVRPGDIILGDRGYGHREGVASVTQAGGDVVVRLNGTSFPLLNEDRTPLSLLRILRTLVGHEPKEWAVTFEASAGRQRARLCAIRKSAAAAAKAKSRIRKVASKKKKTTLPETFELAEYIFVLTTLPATTTTTDVLEFYRARWQAELAFKRIKSLFGSGHVPKYDPESARAWLYAKLVAVLLIERLGEQARLFSPWGFELQTSPQSMA